MNKIDELRYKEMKKILGDVSDKVVLDIGGGLYSLAKQVPTKKTIVIDGDKKFNPDLLMDLNEEKIPLESDSIDVVIAGEIIEHLINPFRFLLELNRILKKGGTMILTTPNAVDIKSRFKVICGGLPTNGAQAFPTKEDHLFFHKADYNLRRIEEMIKKSGFNITQKGNTGLFIGERLIVPPKVCPITFAEKFILEAKK